MSMTSISAADIKRSVEDLKKDKPQYSSVIVALGGAMVIGTTIRQLIMASPGATLSVIMNTAQDAFSVTASFLGQLPAFFADLEDKLIADLKQNNEQAQRNLQLTMSRIQQASRLRQRMIRRNT